MPNRADHVPLTPGASSLALDLNATRSCTTYWVAWLLGILLASYAGRAFAFGLEISPGGEHALARGGAVVARAEDAFTLLHNPAGLADVADGQLLLDVSVPFHDMCVQPYGYYGWGVYEPGPSDFGNTTAVKLNSAGKPIVGATYATDPLDKVCNSQPVGPLPGIAYSWRANDKLGFAIGMLAPTGLGGLQYGGDNGTIQTPNGARPTPTRYQLVQQAVTFALAPTFGLGYRVLPRLRIGIALEWIAAGLQTKAVQALRADTSPNDDMMVRVRVHDYFVPAATLGVTYSPIDRLDVALTAHLYDAFRGSGEAQFTTYTFQTTSTTGPVPFKNDAIKLSNAHTNLPWQFVGGVRYSQPLAAPALDDIARGPKRGDPLSTEQFDVELDVAYQLNARTSNSSVTIEPGTVLFRNANGTSSSLDVPVEGVDTFSQTHHLVNATSVRLGSTYNLVPKRFSVSGGVFYESRGVDLDYANIDTFAFSRLGFGVGVNARFASWDLSVGYGHVFQETVVIAPPPHQAYDTGSEDATTGFDKRVGLDGTSKGYLLPEQNPPKSADGVARLRQSAATEVDRLRARVVNAGVYTAAFNVLAFSAAYRF